MDLVSVENVMVRPGGGLDWHKKVIVGGSGLTSYFCLNTYCRVTIDK